jgi:hypothetical protein
METHTEAQKAHPGSMPVNILGPVQSVMLRTVFASAIAIACIQDTRPADADTIPLVIDPTITIKATASGTATGGTQPAIDNAHAMEYDGPTSFTANYTIVLKADGTVDKTKSTIKFKTTTYTANGMEEPSSFTTLPITITGVTLNKDNTIASFTFSSLNWYPNAAAEGITNNTLSGSINLNTLQSQYTASYKDNTTGGVYKYVVVSVPGPVLGAGLPSLMVGAGGLLAWWGRRRKGA